MSTHGGYSFPGPNTLFGRVHRVSRSPFLRSDGSSLRSDGSGPSSPRSGHSSPTHRFITKIRRTVGRDLQWRWRRTRKRQRSIKRKLEGRNHRQHNWSWPSFMDWTFRPSRRSVICLRGPGPRFTSRGRRSGWSEPPQSGDGGRPRPWHSSWVDEGVNITPAGIAPCDNDQSAASMPLTSRRTEGRETKWSRGRRQPRPGTVGRTAQPFVSAK